MWVEALTVGLAFGGGISLVMAEFAPRFPVLAGVLRRLGEAEYVAEAEKVPWKERVGRWGVQHLAGRRGFQIPEQDLRILGQSTTSYFFSKLILLMLLGAVVPLFFSLYTFLLGLDSFIPAIALLSGIPLGMAALAIGDQIVRKSAAEARTEFQRSVASYLELVALERRRGAPATTALEQATQVANGWAFQMIAERLNQAKLYGEKPWTALERLSKEIQVPDLQKVATVVALAGDNGAAIYRTLMQHAESLRTKLLNEEHLIANRTTERMTAPMTLLGMTFIGMVLTPLIMNLISV